MKIYNSKNAWAKRKKELLNPEWYEIYLDKRDYDILYRAFKWETYREIWDTYGISRQRVEQIIIKETKKLIRLNNVQCQKPKNV